MTGLFMRLGKNKMTILKLKNVNKSYLHPGTHHELKVLESIDLKVNKGESISITGPSGSGKTTLLNICGTLDSPSSGKVVVCGKDISMLQDKGLDELRKSKIGFIFQQHHLLPQLSVLENVLIPALAINPRVENSIVKRGMNLLKIAGLSKRCDHKPGELSGGECQRTAVVRSLINSPDIIFADEPTGSLDYKNSKVIAQLLLEFKSRENLTLVLVTHAEELARKMVTRYILDKFSLKQVSDKDE